MADPEAALEALASLALRSESPEDVAALVAEVRTRGLPDPGPIYTLVMTTTLDGGTNIHYLGTPEWASGVLRDMAQRIDDENVI